MAIIWMNGAWVDRSAAKVSVFDHGLLYGDGVFEGIRAYNGKVFRNKEHVDRLYDSAQAIAMTIPMPREEMARLIEEGVAKLGIPEAYIRPIVTRATAISVSIPRSARRRR